MPILRSRTNHKHPCGGAGDIFAQFTIHALTPMNHALTPKVPMNRNEKSIVKT